VIRSRLGARRTYLILAGFTLAAAVVLSCAGTLLVVERPVAQPDAIVMLASHESERIPAVGLLARQFPSSVILLTVPKTITEYNCTKCPYRVDWLGVHGVENTRVQILPDRTENTHDEALAVLAYWRRTPIQRLAVVTSPYHARRSLNTFEQVFAGTQVHIGIYPATASSPARPREWWWHAYDRGYVAYEWTALGYYLVKYRLPMQQSRHRDPRQPSSTVSPTE
jgi:uncharacterized SAM-binding protein YcdF (DUF218 family)